MSDDLVKRYLDAKKGLRPGPFPTLGGMNVRPRYVVHEHDLDHLAARITALEEENKRLEARVLELQHHAYEWMVAHDKLHAGKPYKFPSPIEPDALSKALDENKRLREALEPFAGEAKSWTFGPESDSVELGISAYNKTNAFCTFTFGDLRRAAATLEKK